jgi:pilus assembly protein TadC
LKFIGLLAVIPFIGFLGGIPLVNKVNPYILGMPFFLFWIVMWVVITSGIMAIIFKLDPKNRREI